MGEHSRNSDTMIFIYLQKLPRCSLKLLPFCCMCSPYKGQVGNEEKRIPVGCMFLEYIYILVEVQLCFCAPFIYGDFIAVAAG